ncbi:MAG: EthD family reductase [Actinomycetota bacterium]
MFKAIILLTRAEGASRAEFRSWWLERHAPLAGQLPGLRRLVFNIVETDGVSYDGVSELWFDTQVDFEDAYASELGQQVVADSLANVSTRVRLFVDEHALFESGR